MIIKVNKTIYGNISRALQEWKDYDLQVKETETHYCIEASEQTVLEFANFLIAGL